LINGAGLVSSVVFLVQASNSGGEAGGHSMLLIEINGTLDGLVSKNVTVGKIFGDNAASWLLLLSELVGVTLGVLCEVASIIINAARGRCDLDFGGTKLCVVQEEGSLGGGFLFEGYGRILSLPSRSDLEGSNLTAAEDG
jgi:hypothetical protein